MAPGGGDRTHGKTEAANDSSGLAEAPASTPGAGVSQLKQLVARGRPSPRVVAQLMAKHPAEQREMLALLHRTAGNAFVQQVLAALRSGAGPASLENEIVEVKLGLEFDALVRKTLLPAYRRAVDALDPAAALELATHIVSAVRAALRGDASAEGALKPGAGAAQVSTPDAPIDDTPQAATRRWAELSTRDGDDVRAADGCAAIADRRPRRAVALAAREPCVPGGRARRARHLG